MYATEQEVHQNFWKNRKNLVHSFQITSALQAYIHLHYEELRIFGKLAQTQSVYMQMSAKKVKSLVTIDIT